LTIKEVRNLRKKLDNHYFQKAPRLLTWTPQTWKRFSRNGWTIQKSKLKRSLIWALTKTFKAL